MPGLIRASVVGLVLVTACGSVPHSGGVVPAPPAASLAAWQSFPSNQVPRPIVLFGEMYPQGFGFADGDTKIAAICNKFTLRARLPTEVPGEAGAAWPDGTSARYRAISAVDAFAAMSKTPAGTGNQCATVSPLTITAARFSEAPWRTDRGIATLTTWLFAATGVNGELAYPAVPASALWGSGMTPYSGNGGATISADGRSLTFSFIGAQEGTGPCQSNYRGVVAESSHAVAVTAEAIPNPPLRITPTPMACALRGYSRSVNVKLASPLGGRVVVDARGDAVAVCPEAMTRC